MLPSEEVILGYVRIFGGYTDRVPVFQIFSCRSGTAYTHTAFSVAEVQDFV